MGQKHLLDLSDLAGQVRIDEDRSQFFQKHFGLKWNPFPELGVPTSDLDDMAPIRKEEIGRITEFILKAFVPPFRRTALVVKGTYGSGKSFVLQKIVSAITSSQVGRAEASALAIYVPRPSIEAHALNRAILRSIGLDNIRKMTWLVIRQELATEIEPVSEDLQRLWQQALAPSRQGPSPIQKRMNLVEALPRQFNQIFNASQLDDYRCFLQEYDKKGFSRSILEPYFTKLLSRGLQLKSSSSVPTAFTKLLLSASENAAWDELVALDASKREDRRDFVLLFLFDLLSLLKASGYEYLFVVVDEFEQATMNKLLTPRQQSDYAYTVLEILTHIENGLGLVIGISTEGFENLRKVVPLVDRLGGVMVELNPLTTEELSELAMFYLALARSSDERDRLSRLYPFSQRIVELIARELSPIGLGLTPRNALQFFHLVLEHHFARGYTEIKEDTIRECVAIFRERKAGEERPTGRRQL